MASSTKAIKRPTSFEGETAPDLSADELKALSQKTKTKPNKGKAKRSAPARRPAPNNAAQVKLRNLALDVQDSELGWDPRITDYLDDPAKIKAILAGPLLSAQNQHKAFSVGGATISELGALRTDQKVRRVVKVVWETE